VTTQKELERALPFEKEVKEKNLLLGKQRHESVILNDHLTKALRFLKQRKPEDMVDRQLVTNHFLHFIHIDRADPKKFQVLQLIAALLSWTEGEYPPLSDSLFMTLTTSQSKRNKQVSHDLEHQTPPCVYQCLHSAVRPVRHHSNRWRRDRVRNHWQSCGRISSSGSPMKGVMAARRRRGDQAPPRRWKGGIAKSRL
jgi:hypothetical protein